MMDEHKLIEKIPGQLEGLAQEFNQLADLMERLQDWTLTGLWPKGTKMRDVEKITGEIKNLAQEFNQLSDFMAELQNWTPAGLWPRGTKMSDSAPPVSRQKSKKSAMPEFDEHWNPTEETLDRIKNWEIKNHQDCLKLLWFCRTAWFCHDYVRVSEDKTRYQFYTGASRTNEDIVKAMQANTIFWDLVWYSSQRGGHYVMVMPS